VDAISRVNKRRVDRIVGLHPFVRMEIPVEEYEQAVANGLADASAPAAAVVDRVTAADEAAQHSCTRGLACTCSSPALAPTTVAGVNERWVINWCSNDYMNMSHNATIIGAMHDALDTSGAGAGGTRNISGSQTTHVQLERDLARMIGHEAALLFNSCYSANLGVMQALAATLPADTLVLSDAENHASLVSGVCVCVCVCVQRCRRRRRSSVCVDPRYYCEWLSEESVPTQ
jgi:7-keto-8-aminopelargonate synthetase-like enzyme